MYIVSHRLRSGLRAGAMQDGKVVDAADLGYPASVRALLAAGKLDAFVADAGKALAAGKSESVTPAQLGPPVPDPDKIICLGLNYRDHAAEGNFELPKAPVLFPKYSNSLTGPADDIVVPAVAAKRVDYECELAAIIGRTARRVSEADALSYVAGYACFNDVSARDLQMVTSQWAPGKAIDTFAPMGPGIVPAAEIGDPQNLMLTTRVNGKQLQHENSGKMIFTIAQQIAFITSFMTLEPGDVIATGTPAGVGFARKPPIYLAPGDVVEVEIEKIGTIRNTVALER